MCLILFAHEMHPTCRLVLAANRDEIYSRPTRPMGFWKEAPWLLAGKDLQAGGTWLGLTRNGRFAAITNYRDPANQKAGAPSRGHLVSGFLMGNESAGTYLDNLSKKADRYNGFNLILGAGAGLYYFSNREGSVRQLSPGIYGLSNHLLNTPWPKVEKGMAGLKAALQTGKQVNEDKLFDLLHDQNRPPDGLLPNTGVGTPMERLLSPLFITSPDYGTRSSTLVMMERSGQVTARERTFDPAGGNPHSPSTPHQQHTRNFSFRILSSH